MRLLVDMNLSALWVKFLRDHGFEAEHWSTIGDCETPDTFIMEHALRKGFVILTRDLDFGIAMVASGVTQPSIVQIRSERAVPANLGLRVLASLSAANAELLQGAVVTIQPDRTRVRLLSPP